MADRFTTQQVAELTGLSVHTLRYYERVGLVHPVGRASSSHRCYAPEDITWIEFLSRLRATGMPIARIASPGAAARRRRRFVQAGGALVAAAVPPAALLARAGSHTGETQGRLR